MIIKKNKTIRRVSILFLAMILFVGLCGCNKKTYSDNSTNNSTSTKDAKYETITNLIWSIEPIWNYDDIADISMPDTSDPETFVTNFFIGDGVVKEHSGSSVNLLNGGSMRGYSQDIFVAKKDGKEGLIDNAGNPITNIEYDRIIYAWKIALIKEGDEPSWSYYTYDGTIMSGDMGVSLFPPMYNLVVKNGVFALQKCEDGSVVDVPYESNNNANDVIEYTKVSMKDEHFEYYYSPDQSPINHNIDVSEAVQILDNNNTVIGTAIVDRLGNIKKQLEGYYNNGS